MNQIMDCQAFIQVWKIKKPGFALKGKIWFKVVGMKGIEPLRSHNRQILSLLRLPVPPHPRGRYFLLRHISNEILSCQLEKTCAKTDLSAILSTTYQPLM